MASELVIRVREGVEVDTYEVTFHLNGLALRDHATGNIVLCRLCRSRVGDILVKVQGPPEVKLTKELQ